MIVGCPKEIKVHEYRVGLTPDSVKAYVKDGHSVYIEEDAGLIAGFTNEEYISAGASIVRDRDKIYEISDMIVKVKEPQPAEYKLLHKGQILFTFLHLAADKELTEALLESGIKAVAYETIERSDGQLPLLRPMSEIAGKLSVIEGSKYMECFYKGRGVLLGGIPGVEKGKVAIIGGGTVGTNAAKIAVGLGAQVSILDINMDQLAYLDDIFGGSINTLYSNDANIEKILTESDLVIGAVLIHGAKAPKLIKRDDLAKMKKGAVLVDVAIDQGGCIETSKPTTYDNPSFIVDDIVHFCVANLPGAVARTSTQALTTSTLKYGLQIANKGLEKAAKENSEIAKGVNIYNGKITYKAVADSLNMDYTPLSDIIA